MQFGTFYTKYQISIYHIFIAIHVLPAAVNNDAHASQY